MFHRMKRMNFHSQQQQQQNNHKNNNTKNNNHASSDSWQDAFREWRHHPCLMKPVSVLVLLLLVLVWIINAILQLPTWILSLVLGKRLQQRFPWIVEFLYPTALGRWLHLTLVEYTMTKHNQQYQQQKKLGDKNRGFHSRCIEQRLEIVPGRVYLHPLPQFLDNLGYLVVCCPPPPSSPSSSQYQQVQSPIEVPLVGFLVDCGQAKSVQKQIEWILKFHYSTNNNSRLQIQAILSTHKHHDHTGGNLEFLNDPVFGKHVQHIVGGAVEQVPGCNYKVAHGDLVQLPQLNGNDMNQVVQVQVICTPAHTRGSVTYALRPIVAVSQQSQPQLPQQNDDAAIFLFTGDTLFCGGSGVPFEADIAGNDDNNSSDLTPTSLIRPTCGTLAMERCFAEILAQCCSGCFTDSSNNNNNNKGGGGGGSNPIDPVPTTAAPECIIFLPGHEYTTELLSRQLMPQTNNNSSSSLAEACKWKNFAPQYFFETVSHLWVALHRRSLPHSSGKLLSAMTTLRRELLINPQLRTLRKRGDEVVRAIHHWHTNFAQVKVVIVATAASTMQEEGEERGLVDTTSTTTPQVDNGDTNNNNHGEMCNYQTTTTRTTTENGDTTTTNNNNGILSTSPSFSSHVSSLSSSSTQWNLKPADLDRKVFCTVYESDLDGIIADLRSVRIDAMTAARHLQSIKDGVPLDQLTIKRRPVPNTLPSNRAIGKALVGFCLLGSTPSGLTFSDSVQLKLPPPSIGGAYASDRIRISKTRLLKVLHMLGVLENYHHDSQQIEQSPQQQEQAPQPHPYALMSAMLDQLWKEAKEYVETLASYNPNVYPKNHHPPSLPTVTYETVDVEVEVRTFSDDDTVELGALRWVVFGIPRPASFLSKIRTCLPCGGPFSSSLDGGDAMAQLDQSHPVHSCGLSQHSGELVRHDLPTCALCIAMTGRQCRRRRDNVRRRGRHHQDDKDDDDGNNNNSRSLRSIVELQPQQPQQRPQYQDNNNDNTDDEDWDTNTSATGTATATASSLPVLVLPGPSQQQRGGFLNHNHGAPLTTTAMTTTMNSMTMEEASLPSMEVPLPEALHHDFFCEA